MAAEQHSPLDQFTVKPLFVDEFGTFFDFTNASFYMLLVVFLVWIFVTFGMRHANVIPGRWQSMVELVYEFIGSMLYDTVGPEARKFFPMVFSLFMFILVANLVGMIPYQFTITSHIIVTFALAALVFVSVTLMGFYNHGIKFFKIFLPSGVPIFLAPLLVVIELISYLIRPVSLSVRLFANMMAGHIMLKVLAGFILTLPVWAGWLPFFAVTALTGLEIVIAILQAYVFAMLTCIYLNDAYHIEH